MKKILFLSALFLSALACKKMECGFSETTDQIIFGVSSSECAGDCSTIYRLTYTHAFADLCDFCPLEDIPFQTVPLEDGKFQIAKPLFDSIPGVLLNTADTVYGCPGCADEGAYYLEITQNGAKHVFRWSGFMTDVPADLVPYFEKVAQTIQDLQ